MVNRDWQSCFQIVLDLIYVVYLVSICIAIAGGDSNTGNEQWLSKHQVGFCHFCVRKRRQTVIRIHNCAHPKQPYMVNHRIFESWQKSCGDRIFQKNAYIHVLNVKKFNSPLPSSWFFLSKIFLKPRLEITNTKTCALPLDFQPDRLSEFFPKLVR